MRQRLQLQRTSEAASQLRLQSRRFHVQASACRHHERHERFADASPRLLGFSSFACFLVFLLRDARARHVAPSIHFADHPASLQRKACAAKPLRIFRDARAAFHHERIHVRVRGRRRRRRRRRWRATQVGQEHRASAHGRVCACAEARRRDGAKKHVRRARAETKRSEATSLPSCPSTCCDDDGAHLRRGNEASSVRTSWRLWHSQAMQLRKRKT
mmetsp:Transcript_6924/g.42252  ORF Transcript_6924/g.42252 Transcript_6924/m.42252 type:complete len:215 (+) Transcript_6924:5651-6295(+)